VEYARFVHIQTPCISNFGNDAPVIAAGDIFDVTLAGTINAGLSRPVFSIPFLDSSWQYGFFEIMVSGISPEGKRITSSPGFIPYSMPLAYCPFGLKFSGVSGETITEALVGDTIRINITGSADLLDSIVIVTNTGSRWDFNSSMKTATPSEPGDTILFSVETVLENIPPTGVLNASFTTFDHGSYYYLYGMNILQIQDLRTGTISNRPGRRPHLFSRRPAEITVYSLTGRKMTTIQRGNTQPDKFATRLPSGVYLFVPSNTGGSRSSGKGAAGTRFVFR
jgi:hypothetical protein